MASYSIYIYSSVGIVLGLLAQQSWQACRTFKRTKHEIKAQYDER